MRKSRVRAIWNSPDFQDAMMRLLQAPEIEGREKRTVKGLFRIYKKLWQSNRGILARPSRLGG